MNPAIKIAMVTAIITLLVLITVIILQIRTKLMSKRVFLYIFFPLLPLPFSITLTYVVWPEQTLHLAVRLLIAVAANGLVMANFYFFSVPFYKEMIPEFKKYFFEGDEKEHK